MCSFAQINNANLGFLTSVKVDNGISLINASSTEALLNCEMSEIV